MRRVLGLAVFGLLWFCHPLQAQQLIPCILPSTPCNASSQVGTGTQGAPAWQAFGIDNANWILFAATLQPPLVGVVTTPGNSNTTAFGSGATAALPSGNLPSGVLSNSGQVLLDETNAVTVSNKTYLNPAFSGTASGY